MARVTIFVTTTNEHRYTPYNKVYIHQLQISSKYALYSSVLNISCHENSLVVINIHFDDAFSWQKNAESLKKKREKNKMLGINFAIKFKIFKTWNTRCATCCFEIKYFHEHPGAIELQNPT